VPAFQSGDVIVGGGIGRCDVLHSDGSHVGYLSVLDAGGARLRVNGIDFLPNGDPVICGGDPSFAVGDNPLDVRFDRKRNSLAMLVAQLDDSLEVWCLNLDGTLIEKQPGLAVGAWVHTSKAWLAVDCGGTMYYTVGDDTVRTWDLDGATQGPDFVTVASPYIAAAIDVTKGGNLVVAKSLSGVGPQQAVAVSSPTHVWTDQLNETPVKVYKRLISDLSDVLSHTVSLDPDDTGATDVPVTALGSYFSPCGGLKTVLVGSI